MGRHGLHQPIVATVVCPSFEGRPRKIGVAIVLMVRPCMALNLANLGQAPFALRWGQNPVHGHDKAQYLLSAASGGTDTVWVRLTLAGAWNRRRVKGRVVAPTYDGPYSGEWKHPTMASHHG